MSKSIPQSIRNFANRANVVAVPLAQAINSNDVTHFNALVDRVFELKDANDFSPNAQEEMKTIFKSGLESFANITNNFKNMTLTMFQNAYRVRVANPNQDPNIPNMDPLLRSLKCNARNISDEIQEYNGYANDLITEDHLNELLSLYRELFYPDNLQNTDLHTSMASILSNQQINRYAHIVGPFNGPLLTGPTFLKDQRRLLGRVTSSMEDILNIGSGYVSHFNVVYTSSEEDDLDQEFNAIAPNF